MPTPGAGGVLIEYCHLNVLVHFDILASCPHGLWIFQKEKIIKGLKCSDALPQAFPEERLTPGRQVALCHRWGLGLQAETSESSPRDPTHHNPQTFHELQNDVSNFY